MNTNVVQLFLEAAERNEHAAALVSASEGRVTFGELRRRVMAFAAGLRLRGFMEADRAVFMLPMSVNLYVTVLGTLAAGGVAVFVDPWVSVRQIARLAAAAAPKAFIGTGKAHLLRWFAVELRGIPLTIGAGGEGLVARLIARHHIGEFSGSAGVTVVSPDASALITYTTGSSGHPKGVNRTHAILAAQHHVIRREFPAEPGDVDLTTFPVFALSNLAAGATTVIPSIDLRRVAEADAATVLRDVRAFGVTTAAASPPLFDRLSDHLRARGEQAPAFRRIVTGGAPVRDDQLRRWRDSWPGTDIVVAFGSSEAEPVASISADERLTLAGAAPGFCVGRPVESVRVRVVGITRGSLTEIRDAPPRAIGELIVSGPHVCRAYVDDPQAFAENKVRDPNGVVWHRMGDTGYFDESGRFWLVGRVHSTIRRNGVDLHAQLIEAAVRADDPRIRRVAALGLADATVGERLAIVVESDHGDLRTDVEARLAAALPDIPVDHLVVTRESLPVDPRHNSKVDYAALRLRMQRGALS